MRSRTLTIACLLVGLILVFAIPYVEANSSQKQKGKAKVTELKGSKETTRGGEADPNIKESKETNDPGAQMDAPPSKGGATTRGGGYCQVQFDNRSRWYIKLYVDGIYRGTLSPFGDAVVYAQPGSTSVYARADFDDGSFYRWGPSTYSCGPGQYIPFRMLP
jgi:hypothetical protein